MAFFQLILKARRLERIRQRYEDEKFRSIELSEGAQPRYTLGQRIRRKKLRCKKRVSDFWDKLTSFTKDTWFHRKLVALRTDGTFENYVLKSILGFLGGVVLTYVFFAFFVFQLRFSLGSATTLCSLIGATLSLGLAFSSRVRCVVFLLLPQFFSKRGRQALMTYAFVLALTGPARNTLHNVGVLTESLACGQEQLKQAVKAVVDLIKQPFFALRDAISKVVKSVKVVVKKIKQTLIAIKRLVLSMLRVIVSVFEWLGSIVNICNKKLGTPFDRCQRVFEGAVADCKAKLGPIFGGICNLTYIVGALCYIVKPLDFICMLVSYVADAVVDAVKRKIKKFTTRVKAMFYVKVKFSHSFHFETNQSKSIEDVSTGIVTEIRTRADEFRAVFDWMSFLTTFFLLFIILRVIHYRHKWLTNDGFDNRYLTNDLRTIDLIRARQDKETVLPLNQRERNRYASLTSARLIKAEKLKLAKAAVLLALATFKLLVYMAIDYCLYWILSTIQYHGRFQTKVEQPNVVRVRVSGDGYLAGLYRSIVRAFTPGGKEMDVDNVPCLPDPTPPDYDRYAQIAMLIIFCWLATFFEPYGLRLRHIVMCKYHPERAKQRATWLYNHIVRSRGNFLKFARRQLRRKFGMTDGEKIEKVTMGERLRAICPLLNKCFPLPQNVCLLCGAVQRSEKNPHVKCPTPGCVGLFCIRCFADLQNLCTICQSPLEYGDLSDLSEEKDSSDERPTRKTRFLDEDATGRSKEDEESSYSYDYQDESPGTETETRRVSFRDLEARKVRDDVTTQIFHESLENGSSDESWGRVPVRARRRIRARLKKESPEAGGADSSSSIADTEFWPTEEEQQEEEEEEEEEETVDTELDDASEKLLPRDRKDKPERGRANRLPVRIPWPGKDSSRKESRKESATRRPSIVSKIASILRKRKPARRSENARREEETVSPTSTSTDDETRSLIRTKSTSESPEGAADVYSASTATESSNSRYSQDKKFPTKGIPRYMESICNETSCFEIDETEGRMAGRSCARRAKEVHAQPGERTSLRNRKESVWNMTKYDDSRGCSCASKFPQYTSVDKNEYSTKTNTVSQGSGIGDDAETGSTSALQNTRDVRNESSSGTTSRFAKNWERFPISSSDYPEETMESREDTAGRAEAMSQERKRGYVPAVFQGKTSKPFGKREFPRDLRTRTGGAELPRRSFEVPAVRKYLPMYQNPELVEELKRHDRMRLIREREARRWKDSACEGYARTVESGEPLVSASRKADGSKEVKQLFPFDRRRGR